MKSLFSVFLTAVALPWLVTPIPASAKPIRIGMVGLDTSHAVQFTKMLNDSTLPEHVPGAIVVAAFKESSPDIESSVKRVDGYAADLTGKYGVRLCATIDEMLAQVDAVLVESVDGRKHLAQAKRVIAAKKILFVDKPLAGSLRDGIEIMRLAQAQAVPCFSASALRFASDVTALTLEQRKSLRTVLTYSPAEIDSHHPDLFWYGVHAVETLYAILGAGCTRVTRVYTPDGDVVTGVWKDGRIGIVVGQRNGTSAFGFKALFAKNSVGGDIKVSYVPLVKEIVKFLQTGQTPVSVAEQIEVLAFMEAADESKRQGGRPVSIADVMKANGGPLK